MLVKSIILFLCLLFSPLTFSSVPFQAYTFDVDLSFSDYDRHAWERIDEAAYLLKLVIQTDEFKKSILRHRFNGKRTFHQNLGLSNKKIYQSILDGAEKLNNHKNNTFDAEIDFFFDNKSNVIGFTKKTTNKIWINKKYFYQFNPPKLAGHLMHEWLHKLGFSHERIKTDNRKFSVPYSIGRIVRDISTKLFDSGSYHGL